MRRVILAIVCTAAGLALLLSFKTRGTTGLASIPQGQNGTSPSSAGSPAAVSGSAGGSGSKPASSTSTTTASKTVAGDVAQTIYGPIQVTITVKDGKVSSVSVPEYPDGTANDQQINSFALPELIQETIAADSARIDSVSGATYTSQGYVTSLQSALDKAGL